MIPTRGPRILTVAFALVLAQAAAAQTPFVEIFDDFEDGDLAGWAVGGPGCDDQPSPWQVEDGKLVYEQTDCDECSVLYRPDLVGGFDYVVEIVARSIEGQRLRFAIHYVSPSSHVVADARSTNGNAPTLRLAEASGDLLAHSEYATGFSTGPWRTYEIQAFGEHLQFEADDIVTRVRFPSPRSGSFAILPPAPAGCVGRVEIDEIRIRRPAPEVRFLSVDTPDFGDPLYVLVETAYVSSASLEPGFVELGIGLQGWIPLPLSETTTFTLLGSNAGGAATATQTVTPDPPGFHVFRLTPPRVVRGAPINLIYDVSSADSLVLRPGNVRLPVDFGEEYGDFTVVPLESATLEVTAYRHPYAPLTRTAPVTVDPLEILSFTATPAPAIPGQPVFLNWSTNAADSVLIDPLGLVGTEAEGSTTVSVNEATTYTLRCRFAGQEVQSTLELALETPRVRSFDAASSTIAPGETTRLSWNCTYGDSVLVEPLGLVSTNMSGGVDVEPGETTSYTIHLFHAGVLVDSETMTVNLLDIVFDDAGVSQSVQDIGGPVEVRWNVQPSDVEVFVDGEGPFEAAGARVLYPIASRDIVIEARRDGVVATRVFPLTAVDPAPDEENLLLVADPSTLVPWIESVPSGIPFDVYAVAAGPTQPVGGFSFRLDLPPCVFVLEVEYPPAFQSFSSSVEFTGVYGPGNPCDETAERVQLARFSMLAVGDGPDGCLDVARTIRSVSSTGAEHGLRTCGPDGRWTDFGAHGEFVVGAGQIVTGVDPDRPRVLRDGVRMDVHPNPFNPRTTIRFQVEHPQTVRLRIVDIAGRSIRDEWIDVGASGEHQVVWDGRDALGRRVASGVFFVVLQTESETLQRKMTLVR